MQVIYHLIFLALIFCLFWLIHKAVTALRYDVSKRYLGCRSLAALVLELAALNVFSFQKLLKAVNALISMPELQSLWNVILPQRSFRVLFLLLVFLFMNMLILLLTIAVLSSVRLIYRKNNRFVDLKDKDTVFTLTHFPWILANKYYEDEDGEFYLTQHGFILGIWAKGLKYVFLAFWALQIIIMSVSAIWGNAGWNERLYEIAKTWYQLPFAMFLFTEQIQFFLETDRDAESDSCFSESVNGIWKGDLVALMRVYAEIFKDSGILLHSHAEEADDRSREAQSNHAGAQQHEDCTQPEVLDILGNQLRNSEVVQNDNYQNALVAMLNRKNVNICDYSRGEFLIYLAAYLNYHFSLGKTALIICESEEGASSFSKTLKSKFGQLNIIGSIWNICTRSEVSDNRTIHALVVGGESLADDHLLDKNKQFTDRLFLVAVDEGDKFFTRSSIEITRIFHEIRKTVGSDRNLQYLVFSPMDNTNLRTAMEQHIGTEVNPFRNDVQQDPAVNGIMVWGEEGIYKPQIKLGLGDSRSDYMGTAIPLALIGLKFDIHRVYILPDSARADEKYDEVMTGFTKDVHSYLGKAVNLKSAIRYSPEETTDNNDLKMVILYDNVFNLPEVLRFWKKYSGTYGGLFHVISPPYMLRGYFAQNYEKFRQSSSSVYEMVPYYIGMKRSHMAALLISLSRGGMTEQKLMEKNNEFNWGYQDVVALLRDCLSVILRDVEMHNVYEYFHFHQEPVFNADENRFESEVRIELTDESVCRMLNEYFSNAVLIANEETSIDLPMLKGDIYNYYLEDQMIAVEGQFYKIHAIRQGHVYGKQITPETLYRYYQVSDFMLRNWEKIDSKCSDYTVAGMELGTAHSIRNIYGYWGSNNGNRFAAEDNMVYIDCTDKGLSTAVDSAYVLRITLKNQDPEKTGSLEMLLALMLNELFCTLFPRSYQNLFAITTHGKDNELLSALRSGRSSVEQRIRSIIPAAERALPDESGNYPSTMAEVYVVEHSTMEFGMAEMIYQHREKVFSLLRDYLEWYLDGEARSSDNGGYLNFGLDHIPDIFAAHELLDLCRQVTPDHEEIVGEAIDHGSLIAAERSCTFCGRPVIIYEELSDGRCMCSLCKEHQVSARDEITALYQSERKIMEDGYHIEGMFPANIHIQFRSAESILKRAGASATGRVLGFYEHDTRQLWIENGGPWTSMRATVFHELTHAWQYQNLNIAEMTDKLPCEKKADREYLMHCILEGFAVYVELESMERINERSYCKTYYAYLKQQHDVYSTGLELVEGFIEEKKHEGSQMTPFVIMKELETMILEGNYPLRTINSAE